MCLECSRICEETCVVTAEQAGLEARMAGDEVPCVTKDLKTDHGELDLTYCHDPTLLLLYF